MRLRPQQQPQRLSKKPQLLRLRSQMKLFQKKEALVDKMGFVEDFTEGQISGIGLLEITGSMGLILPRAIGVLVWLTPTAAIGLALTMVGAFLTHLRRNELVPMGIMNIVLFLMAVVIIIGRFFLYP